MGDVDLMFHLCCMYGKYNKSDDEQHLKVHYFS